MQARSEVTGLARLIWSLVLGLGLLLGLLYALTPHSAVEAQAVNPSSNLNLGSGQGRPQTLAAAQDVNPGFTVDLTYDAVYGLVSPGDVVTVARTVGGAAYGVAEADGVGFFWTPLWQSNGQSADVAGGDTLAVYVDGALSATMSPRTITGQMDVLNDRVVGTISGDTGGTLVTVTMGIWAYQPSLAGAPQATATTDSSGVFTATFANDLGPHNYARVEYADGSGIVVGYVYPSQVFHVDTMNWLFGFATPGQTVTATLVRGGNPLTPTTSAASWPHGSYSAEMSIQPDDVVEVDLGGGTVISTVASSLTAYPDAALDRVTGTCPPDEAVRVWAWNWRLNSYAEVTTTADASGNYTATFAGYDLKPSDGVFPAFADEEGDEVLLSTAPPRIVAYVEDDGVVGTADAPYVPYTFTLYHAPDSYVRTGTTQLGYYDTGWTDFGVDIAPGDRITLETATWAGSMTVADLSFDFDTAGDRVLGQANVPGWAMAWAQQWRGWEYPIHGQAGVTAAVSSPFTATFTGFDLRHGGYARIDHYDANGHHTVIERDLPYFEVEIPYGVGGVPPSADEPVTATLYTAGGGFLAFASDDHDGNPWRFWLDDFGPYSIEPGNWVTVTSESGWTAGLQVPDLTIEADRVADRVWGQGPKSLLYVEGGGGDSGFYEFVPCDDYVVDAAFFGHDLQWGDYVAARYLALDGNQVRREYRWPRITARYEMDGRNTVFGRDAIPGNTITITVTDEASQEVDSGTTFPGSGWEGSTSYALDFPDGTLVPSHTVTVDFGDGFVDAVHVVTITGCPDPDTDVVTGTAPPESSLYAWGEHRWGDRRHIDDVQVDASGVYTLDFGAEGWDVQYGDEFHVYYHAPRNHEVGYVFWLPAPDLGVEKDTTPGVARPGGTYLYRMRYRNEGNGLAENTIITDALPADTTYLTDTSGFPVTDGGSVVTWTLGPVPPDAEGEFYVALNVDSDVSTQTHLLANCAGIATTTPGDYDSGNDESCSGEAWVDEGDAGIWVDKWPEPDDPHPGQEFFYEIEYGSDGGAATGPVWLTDTLPISTTFVRWDEDDNWDALWTEVVTTGGQFVLKAPAGIPGDMGGRILLTLRLDDDVPIGTWLENNVVVSTAGDVDPGNNEDTDTNARASGPRYEMRLEKWTNSAVLAPGGRIDYHIEYDNEGNVATQAWVTDTLPAGTFYVPGNARWRDGGPPFEPAVVGDQLVWDLGQVGVEQEYGLDVMLYISDTVSPGTVLTNCATVGITPTEDTLWDNTSCVAETVYTSGLNLRVTKEHDWEDDDRQLEYEIRVENIGTQRLEDVWITDTYPISTTFNDDWWMDHGPSFDPTHDAPNRQLIFWTEELDSGQTAEIRFRVDLDDPDARPRWYTNTVEIQTPPGDVNLADNTYTDVAVKGEVDRAEMRVGTGHGDMWGEAQPNAPVTVTTPLTQVTGWVGGDGEWHIDDVGTIDPGDTVIVEAGSGLLPVVIPVPDPFTAYASSITDTVWGQIATLEHEEIDVDLQNGPTREVWTDDSGNYSVTFDDVPRVGRGEVRYETDFTYAEVTFHRDFQTPDLAMTVDYGDDWVQGNYEPGHTLWITVTESDGTTIRATAVLTTGPIPWWGGNSGFQTQGEDWVPAYPDFEPGDWVYGRLDNGYTTTVHVGTIDGQVDPDTDVVSGTIHASWFSPTGLTVRCEIHEDNGESIEIHGVDPDGGGFECNFGGRFDILPGHNVAVNYLEPDGDWVQTHPPNPAPDLRVDKWVEGSRETSPGGTVVYGVHYYNNGDGDATGVVLTDTLPPTTTYSADSSEFPATPSGDTVTWDMDTLAPGSQGRFYLVLDVDSGAVLSDTIARNVITVTAGNYEPGDWQGDNGAKSDDFHVGSGSPDLYVSKHSNLGDPVPGQTFLYQINYDNHGPAASGPVLLTDTLPLSTTFVSWFSNNGYTLWTEEITTGGQFVLSAPALPGYWGDQIYLRLRVSDAVTYNTQLTNTVEITTAGDSDPNNNWDQRNDVWVSSPRWGVSVDKSWGGGQLVPGGQINYNIHWNNNGNMAAHTWLTDTLPAGTTFLTATQWIGYDYVPLEPSHVGGGIVAWDLGVLEPGEWGDFNLRLAISRTVAPDTTITNCATIAITQTDNWPYDNTDCVVEAVRDVGPNLRVRKESWWDWEEQIDYRIRVENIGTTRMEDIWITDTYPISTTFEDNWWKEGGPWITRTHDAPNRQLIFWAQDLNPGNSASIRFAADLDESLHGVQGLIFTNTVEAPWPGDVHPADNTDVELAYTGPDVYVEKWLSGGELRAREIVTFTVEFGNRNSWWNGDDSYGSHITDTLPPEMSFLTAVAPWDPEWLPNELPGNVLEWGWGSMGSRSTWYFDVVAQITDTVRPYDVMTNTVEAYGDSPTDVEAFWDNNVFDLVLTVPMSNSPPSLSGLPDQWFTHTTSLPGTTDLWPYAWDAESEPHELTYTVEGPPPAGAGVTIDSNRTVIVNPSATWCGGTEVTIRATDPGGLWGTDTFSVAVSWSCRGPLAPTLVSPREGSTVTSRTPTFAWSAVADADAYQIQVDDADEGHPVDKGRPGDFSSPEIDETLNGTEYTPASGLSDGIYTWRVRASNAAGAGDWSPALEFAVAGPPASGFEIFLPMVVRDHP